MQTLAGIAERLDHFDREERRNALQCLLQLREEGGWIPPRSGDWMNLHGHTFHSYNSEGWSPTRLVFEGVQAGLEIIGSVDFDVLEAMEEVFEAGDLLGVKTTVGLETRIFIPEYADKELNSPGEPGIAYFMVVGCYRRPAVGGEGESILNRLKKLSENRNREMVARINSYLVDVQVDYDSEVIPSTPSGNPTERHLVEAYVRKGREVFSLDPSGLVAFWAERFRMKTEEVEAVIGDENRFQELLRSKLMKKGGVGYAQPDPDNFPTLNEMVQLAASMDAIPAYAYLDGTTAGESNMDELLSFMAGQGVAALNIIPDRNWNISDPESKRIKIGKLYEAVEAARRLSFPLCIGTELNKKGLPFVDRFDAAELAPVVEDFRKGGRALWGHTLLARSASKGWTSSTAAERFGDSLALRLDFYSGIGARFEPGSKSIEALAHADFDLLKA